jgi:toxin ParE1/3/4
MIRVDFTPVAEADLDDIWFAIAQDSLKAADRMIDLLRERTEQLAMFPESGPLRPEIGDTVRSLVCRNYLILYRIHRRQVEVVRIVHGARDLTALF